ncbi:MAG: rhodanese-like domain-containing protein [Clostridia bacterium]
MWNLTSKNEIEMTPSNKYKLRAVPLLLALAFTQAHGQTKNGNLVDAEWLRQTMGKPNVVLLDASPTKMHIAGHIPGAVSVSFTKEQNTSQGSGLSYGGGVDQFTDQTKAAYAFQEVEPKKLEKLFRSWGINPDSQVVLYDQGGSFLATRLFYSLVAHGMSPSNVYILDGGLHKWKEKGLPTTEKITPAPKIGNVKASAPSLKHRIDLPEFISLSGNKDKYVVVEGLGANWHFGEALNYDRHGHIPYAKMIPSVDFFNADKTFKSAAEIKKIATYNGATPDKSILTQCGGGIGGSVPYFALKYIAKYPNVRHFQGSQLAWLNDERALPFWTYDAPYLMRETNWLQWWGGLRTRTLGNIQVSIVDTRSRANYQQGHIPFALNVPAETFSKNISSPAELSEILGKAGVNPAHEAVIVSNGGVTKEAALAYVALDSLGQRRVSIFMDTTDTWGNLGFELKETDTVVAPRTIPHDLAIPPVKYEAAPHKDVLANGEADKSSLYGRVYVASGKDPLKQSLSGKTIHVPYMNLLDANGKPKAAKDIWKIFNTAGLPRYAEVVLVSEDPGEAAVNYYILKLMGWPDVKVKAL